MPNVKIAGTLSANAADAMGRHAASLYATPGKRVLTVTELAHSERMQPAPDEGKAPSVTLRISSMEIAETDQEEILREVMRALYLARTAQGTLDGDGEIELSNRTLELAADRLLDLEVARMAVALRHWASQAREASGRNRLTLADAKKALDTIAAGLLAATGIRTLG